MNLVRITILLISILLGQTAVAQNAYLINFGDDLWSVELLTETCPYRLEAALNKIASSLSSEDQEIVALLPEKLGYQFFRVEFKELRDGRIVDLDSPIAYKFQYWTEYDEHQRCLKVEPYNIAKEARVK